jgi:hypothetical protein
MMQIDSLTPGVLRLRKSNESVDNFFRRLVEAQLTKAEQREIDAIYQRLDVEWQAAGYTTPPASAPWTSEDVLEWRTLKPHERYLDLKGWAQHVARHGVPGHPAPRPAKQAAPTSLACDGVHVGNGTVWGMPNKFGGDANWSRVAGKYAHWLANQHPLLRRLPELRGKKHCGCGRDRDALHADFLFSLAAKTRDDLIAWWRAHK